MTTTSRYDLQLPEGALRIEPISDEKIISLEETGESEYLSAVWRPTKGRYFEMLSQEDGGYIFSMPISDLVAEMVHKEDADCPLVDGPAARLVFNYPMGKPSFVRMAARDGQAITWCEVITLLAEGYAQIYGIEREALAAGGSAGRAGTGQQSPFEIWGHDLGGLALTGFTIIKADGVTWIMPEIES